MRLDAYFFEFLNAIEHKRCKTKTRMKKLSSWEGKNRYAIYFLNIHMNAVCLAAIPSENKINFFFLNEELFVLEKWLKSIFVYSSPSSADKITNLLYNNKT